MNRMGDEVGFVHVVAVCGVAERLALSGHPASGQLLVQGADVHSQRGIQDEELEEARGPGREVRRIHVIRQVGVGRRVAIAQNPGGLVGGRVPLVTHWHRPETPHRAVRKPSSSTRESGHRNRPEDTSSTRCKGRDTTRQRQRHRLARLLCGSSPSQKRPRLARHSFGPHTL